MTTRTYASLLCLLPLLISGTALAARYPMTVTDSRGKKVTIQAEPQRIVSTAPSNTEIVYALGLGPRVVGVTGWCDYPAEAKNKPKVGDRIISTEKVISLKPDLVLAHGFLNLQAIRALEAHGIRVVAIDPKTLAEVARDIRLVGRIANRENQADEVARGITMAAAHAKKLTAGLKPRPKVLVAVQGDPLWAAGPKTFVDEMIKLSGATNLMADGKPGFNQVSAEAAVFRNPDIIIATTKTDPPIFGKGIWARTKAAKNHRIYYVNPDLVVRPGPRLAAGITQILRVIQPGLFKGAVPRPQSRVVLPAPKSGR